MFAHPAISLTFDQPGWWLLAVAAALPVVAAVAAKKRGRPRRAIAVALRAAAVLLVAAALARPALTGLGGADRPWLVLTDVSASVRGQADRTIAIPEQIPTDRLQFAGQIAAPGRDVPTDATEIGPALRLAASRAGSGRAGGVVLATDGQFTDAGWPRAASELGRSGAPVLIAPRTAPPPDARVVDLSVRRSGDRLRLSVTASATEAQTRALTISRDGQTLYARRIQLLPDLPVTIHLPDSPPQTQAATYVAELNAADAFAENDRVAAIVTPSRPEVAVIALGPAPPVDLPDDVSVTPVRWHVDWRPTNSWMSYAGVVVVSPLGLMLTDDQRRGLADYVRAGGGLLLIGSGPRYTLADRDDPLNQVAALAPNPFERQPLAVTVVLDASGSMASADATAEGLTRFQQAAQATLALQQHLTDQDTLEVIAFNDQPRTVYESGDGPPDFAALDEALQAVQPGGPTDVWPALQRAARPAGPPRRRLILVVSDLETKPFDVNAAGAALRAADASVFIFTVSASGDGRRGAPVAQLAGLQDLSLIHTDDLRRLAEAFGMFARESRGPDIQRGRFPVTSADADVGGSGNVLHAYIPCAPAADTTTVLGRIGDDPVLAVRHVGLGRSAMLAVPVQDDQDTRDRSAITRLTRGVAAWMVRPPGDPRLTGQVGRVRDGAVVRIRAADDGAPMSNLSLSVLAARRPAGGLADRIDMQQIAPGVYEATVPNTPELVGLSVVDESGRAVWIAPLREGYAAEFAALGANWPNLNRLATLTGGRIVSDLTPEALSDAVLAADRRALWPWAIGAALAMMVADWLIGRRTIRTPMA